MRANASALLATLALVAHPAAAAEPYVVISEIQYHDGDDIAELEYVELHNAGDADADLTGWFFEQGIAYRFPGGTRIPAGGFLVVARDADAVRAVYDLSDGVLGNYEGELADGGERVRLIDGTGNIADDVRYDDRDPWPTECDGRGPSLERVGADRPSDLASTWRGSRGLTWRRVEWRGLVIGGQGYIYLPVAGEALIDDLEVHSVAAPERNLVAGGAFETSIQGFTLGTTHRQSAWDAQEGHAAPGALRIVATGTTASPSVGIRFALTPRPTDGTDVVIRFWLKPVRGQAICGGVGISGTNTGGDPRTIQRQDLVSFGSPGRPNSFDPADAPPFIGEAWNDPLAPNSTTPVTIFVPIEDESPIASARLGYADMFGTFKEVPLLDDGVDPDPQAGDRIFAARIPALKDHHFVRYWIEATDAAGKTTRRPDPVEEFPYLAYWIDDGDPMVSDLPDRWIFIPSTDLAQMDANPGSNVYHPATLVWDGTVYDSIRVRYRGGSVRGHPKKFYKVKFNRGRRLDGQKTLNLNSEYPDYSRIRTHISYELCARAGIFSCQSEFFRLYRNGQYYGVYLALEDPEDEYVERQGRAGALYKSYSTDVRPASIAEYYNTYRKQSRQHESYADIVDFIARINSLSGAALQTFVRENIQVDQVARFCAISSVLGNLDWGHKNHYLFRDATTGLWEFAPWDMDLTMGKNWPPCQSVFCHDGQYNHTLIMGSSGSSVYNKVADSVLQDPAAQQLVKDYVKLILREEFTPEKMHPWVDSLYRLISDETVEEIRLFRSFSNQMTEAQFWAQRDVIKQWVIQRRDFLLPQLLGPVQDLAAEVLAGNRVRLTWVPEPGTQKVRIRVDRRATALLDVPPGGGPMEYVTEPLAEGSHQICAYGMTGSTTTSPACIDIVLEGVAAISNLACSLAEIAGPPRSPGAQLTWKNVGTYDDVAFWISTGGDWQPAGTAPGANQAASVPVAVADLGGMEAFTVRAVPRHGGKEAPPAECRVEIVLAPPHALECLPAGEGRKALLSWADGIIPGGRYDAVEVLLDGQVLHTLAPPPFPAVYVTPVIPSPPSPRRLGVRGVWFGRRTGPVECEMEFPATAPLFLRGDVDVDAQLTLGDPIALLNRLFAGAAALACDDAADADDSGDLTIGDAIGLLSYLFTSGAPPKDPGPTTCGVDPTADDALDCASFAACMK